MVALLSKDSILAADDLPYKDVAVPEWGGAVRVRAMSGGERDAYEAMIYEIKGDNVKVNHVNARARLVALSVVDETGAMLFSVDDVEALGKKSARALDRVYAAARKLNAISPADVEELTKN